MTDGPPKAAGGSRLAWIDITKGLSILLIVFFHFFSAYDMGRYPWPLGLDRLQEFVAGCGTTSTLGKLSCFIEGGWASILERGPHAVGVFIFLSGFGLTYSLAKTGEVKGGWLRWYRKRLLRLFPMYWVAHLVCLVSPFAYVEDRVDYRLALSLIGDRVFPVEAMFYYLVPAWWFLGLLIELYLVYPLLYSLLKKLGPCGFLALCGVVTMLSRYLLSEVIQANGNYVQGAFFGGRLWEFAAGMVFAVIYRRHPGSVEDRLFSWTGLLAGAALYTFGIWSYRPGLPFVWSDALIGVGFFVVLAHVARLVERLPAIAWIAASAGVYSYGLYLLHQPYVIYFGHLLRGRGMAVFTLTAFVIVNLIALGSGVIERLVNRVAGRFIDGPRTARVPTPPSAS